ncbi:glutaredoxin 3 [Schistosoma japonicum]|nr:glutaredoxin 3 [Schistosoma japonicum]
MQYFTNMCSTNFIDAKIKQRRVLLISKQKVPICQTIEGILGRYNLNRKQNDNFEILYIDARKDCGTIETYLWHKLIYRDRRRIRNKAST